MPQEDSRNPAQTYEDFFVPAIFSRWAPVLLEHAKPVRGERVLDVACGTGAVARVVAPLLGEEGRLLALDINPAMLAVARSLPRPDGAEIEWLEGSAMDLPEGEFDLVLCQQGLQFFPERSRALEQMRERLGSTGRVALSVWRGLEHQPVYRALFESEARHMRLPLEEVSTPFMLGDADELRTLMTEAGFQRVDVIAEERQVTFPSRENFVALTTLAAAAVMPEPAQMSDEEQKALIAAITEDMGETLDAFDGASGVAFPMSTHIVIGYT